MLAAMPCVAADKLPQVNVALQGKADFHTLQEAIDHAPPTGEIIRLAPGIYREKIHIKTPDIHLVGTGRRPEDVLLSWNDSAAFAGGTGKSGSVSVDADGFEAENLSMENTWEHEHTRSEQGSQAVALLLNSDRAVLDRVRLLGAQDTLYANSRTCHDGLPSDGSAPSESLPPCQASRQYFHDCYIEGHVDYIFGDAKAVFEHCELHSRRHDTIMITAQSRHYPAEDSGYTFLHCRVTGEDNSDRLVLGRPWRDFSTVTFYDTEFQQKVDPAGWSDWSGRLKTSTYREYRSHGPGVNGGHRIVPSPELTPQEENGLTARTLLEGKDGWDSQSALATLQANLR